MNTLRGDLAYDVRERDKRLQLNESADQSQDLSFRLLR